LHVIVHAKDVAPRSQPSPDFVSQRLDDEVVLINLRTNKVFSLNRTGARVWELLQTGHDRKEIRLRLLKEFDVQPEALDDELERLVALLAAEGFVPERGTSRPREARGHMDAPKRRGLCRNPPRAGGPATASLLIRMGAWSLVLPMLKHVLSLPTLVRLMSGQSRRERSDENEKQIVRSARRVYRLRPPGSCLERSLLAYRYLSTAGADPQLLVGVRRDDRDLVGHAWVLVDGSPLYESSASLESFVPVVAFAPDGSATTTANGRAGSIQPLPRL
jgi:hypothetical protein